MSRRPQRQTHRPTSWREASPVERVGAPGTLSNMSSRPRTMITRRISPVGTDWVEFSLEHVGVNIASLELDNSLLERLEVSWQQLGLTGATLLRPAEALRTAGARPALCLDADLTLNVILRARGRLLLAVSPLIDDLYGETVTSVATDDPRLVAAAARHKAENNLSDEAEPATQPASPAKPAAANTPRRRWGRRNTPDTSRRDT
jgi:hypothetical protein